MACLELAISMASLSERRGSLPGKRKLRALIDAGASKTSPLAGSADRVSAVASRLAIPTISASDLDLPTFRLW